jgi:hypothetical protein
MGFGLRLSGFGEECLGGWFSHCLDQAVQQAANLSAAVCQL